MGGRDGAVRAAAQPAFTAGASLTGEAGLYATLLRPLAPGAFTFGPRGSAEGPVHAAIEKLLSERADAAASEAVLNGLGSRTVQGDDALVLAAFALRRAGGEGWSRFREHAAELARATGASGAALQVTNRMDRMHTGTD
jgi:hypothetical protein